MKNIQPPTKTATSSRFFLTPADIRLLTISRDIIQLSEIPSSLAVVDNLYEV